MKKYTDKHLDEEDEFDAAHPLNAAPPGLAWKRQWLLAKIRRRTASLREIYAETHPDWSGRRALRERVCLTEHGLTTNDLPLCPYCSGQTNWFSTTDGLTCNRCRYAIKWTEVKERRLAWLKEGIKKAEEFGDKWGEGVLRAEYDKLHETGQDRPDDELPEEATHQAPPVRKPLRQAVVDRQKDLSDQSNENANGGVTPPRFGQPVSSAKPAIAPAAPRAATPRKRSPCHRSTTVPKCRE
jgi:hypothetical protein